MGWRDDWPFTSDGQRYDGKHLMDLIRSEESPFRGVWDVKLLIKEIEENLDTKGFHLTTSNGPDMVARLARGDVNMPGFNGFSIEKQVPEVLFEAATYELLRDESDIRASRLLYYRPPVQHPGAKLTVPSDLSGRRLLVFERAEGVNNVWDGLSGDNKLVLLGQLAHIRASLFRYHPPFEFATKYIHERLFDFKPASFSMPVAPTREFWMHVLQSKIEATIKNEGDTIGWEDDNEIVGPIALAAKKSLLRAIPHIFPLEDSEVPFYRFVLEHGDFGIHNTSITEVANGEPFVTSLYDWETACIIPALLSDPLVAAGPVDLIAGEDAKASVTRLPQISAAMDLKAYAVWAEHYIKKLYHGAPDYEVAIRAGKDVRYLWFALRDWHGGNSEEFFGGLGVWAERRMKDLGPNIVQLVNEFEAEIIMQYVPMGNLRDQCRITHLSQNEPEQVLVQSLSALSYLHEHYLPFVHRDIKPDNILVQSRAPMHLKLSDFGLSKASDSLHMFCGAPLYVAPEIFALREEDGDGSYTAAVDNWSLGATILEFGYGLPRYTNSSKFGVRWCKKLIQSLAV